VSFDDEVEKLKKELATEREGDPARAHRVAALERMRELLEKRIATKRVEFHLENDPEADDEPCIRVLYAATSDDLGAVFVEDGGFTFESDDDDYFADVPETADPDAFAGLLYESLKLGLPAYELDLGEGE
jgi:hypothetical protein